MRGLAGRDQQALSQEAGATVRSALHGLASLLPRAFVDKVLAPLQVGTAPLTLVLLNRQHLRPPAELDHLLTDGDVITFVPPMEGG